MLAIDRRLMEPPSQTGGSLRSGGPARGTYGNAGAAVHPTGPDMTGARVLPHDRLGEPLLLPAPRLLGELVALRALATDPAHEQHREHGHHRGRRQPPQDLHGPMMRHGPAAATPDTPHSVKVQGALTHSSSPSANTWCFHTGTRCLRRSMSAREASYAWPRCLADAATSTARSPISRCPVRCTAARATTSNSAATSSATSRSRSSAVGWAV